MPGYGDVSARLVHHQEQPGIGTLAKLRSLVKRGIGGRWWRFCEPGAGFSGLVGACNSGWKHVRFVGTQNFTLLTAAAVFGSLCHRLSDSGILWHDGMTFSVLKTVTLVSVDGHVIGFQACGRA